MRDSVTDSELVAYILILLHVVGLLGLFMMVAAYARCYRASYRAACNGPPATVLQRQAQWAQARETDVDLEAQQAQWARWRGDDSRAEAAGPGGSSNNTGPAAHAQAHHSSKSWTCPVCEERNNHTRTECNNCGRAKPPETFAGGQADSVPERPAEPAASRTSARSSSAGPRAAGSAPNPTPTMGTTERPPVGSPPRAWLWIDDAWTKVRVMRTSAEGYVTVRLTGGALLNTRQHLLRPRGDGDDPPGAPPTRPASASDYSRARPSSKNSTSSQPGSSSTSAPKAPSTSATGAAGAAGESSTAAQNLSPEEQWAAERLVRLRKELQELDGKPPAERRSGLRALQRELHPDKWNPEMREHTQPLFLVVQKEWEVVEAAARSASKEGAEGTG